MNAQKYDPRIHNRRSIRLKVHDYSGGGLYFVTICAHQEFIAFAKGNPFGERATCVSRGAERATCVSPVRGIIEEEWRRCGEVRDDVSPGEFVVMPDHFHGLIRIQKGRSDLGHVIGAFKAAVSRSIRRGDTHVALSSLPDTHAAAAHADTHAAHADTHAAHAAHADTHAGHAAHAGPAAGSSRGSSPRHASAACRSSPSPSPPAQAAGWAPGTERFCPGRSPAGCSSTANRCRCHEEPIRPTRKPPAASTDPSTAGTSIRYSEGAIQKMRSRTAFVWAT